MSSRDLPEDHLELHMALGLDKPLHSLEQVKMIQAQLSEWIVSLAEEKYPEMYMGDMEAALALCHEAARERWGGYRFDTLVEALNDAERAMLRDADEVMA